MDLGTIIVYTVTYFSLFTASMFMLTLLEQKDSLKTKKPTRFPTITVAIPAYNEENTLKGTVESLLNLNYPKEKIKIYIVNDGSSDNTLKIANSFKSKGVVVIDKPNSGKADSLNQVLKVCDTELFAVLDADSFAHKDSVRRMIGHLEDEHIMAVTPSMLVDKPTTFLLRVQYIEYLVGVFLRKVFAFLGAIHVTPGPLSIYKLEFFKKYGGYALNNITEDIEVALRIQSKGYDIENAHDAIVTTTAPTKLKALTTQRVRWYSGFMQNTWNYKHLFSPKYGNLGLFILPASFFSVVLVIAAMLYTVVTFITKSVIQRYLNLKSIDFQFWKMFELNFDIFYINLNAVALLSMVTLITGITIVMIAKNMAQIKKSIAYSYICFFLAYWLLFGYWWIHAGVNLLMKQKQSWGAKKF